MQFWCSAKNTAWTWEWQAIYGVWLFIAALAGGVFALNRASARKAGVPGTPVHPLFVLGLATLWIALDWPIGALGAGYLASVHMLQFILIALIAPPALLHGFSPATVERFRDSRLLRTATAPIMAIVIFNAIVLLTHLPPIVDALMPSQLGNLLIDVLWLIGGTLFYWPLVLDLPAHARFSPPLRMLYVIGGLMFSPVMFGLVGFMVYAQRPLYALYELAPPLAGWTAREDHQLAGVMMSITGATIAFIIMSVIFFRWSAKEG